MRVSIFLIALLGATALFGQVRVNPVRVSPEELLLMGEQGRGSSYLGVALVDIDAERAKALRLGEPRGAEVTRVNEGSPAEKAGIKSGDVLLTYNGENVLGAQQLGRLVAETPQGRKITLQLWRDGKTQSVTVITEARTEGNFNVPPTEFLNFKMPELQQFWLFDRPAPLLVWTSQALGVEWEPVDSQLAEYFGVKQGVLVRSVTKGSAAEKAGLKAGDVVTSIGEKPVASPRDISGFLRMQQQPGKPIAIQVERQHRELTLNVTPPSYPQ